MENISKKITIRSATQLWFLLGVSALTLTGCAAGIALHHDMIDNNQVYANSTNEQLLINLARAAADEPPYFVQLGTINNQHSFSSTGQIQSGDNVSLLHTALNVTQTATRALTLGGSLGGTVNDQPTFAFTPLAGTSFTQAMTGPISEKTFLTYMAENYPADIIARILIQQVAVREGPDSQQRDILVNDPQDPTYPLFLQFCSYLRFYQYEGNAYIIRTDDEHKIKKGEAVSFDLGESTTDASPSTNVTDSPTYPGPTPLKESSTNAFSYQTNTVTITDGKTTTNNGTVGSTNNVTITGASTNTTSGDAPASASDSKSGGQSAGAGAGNGPKAADIETGMATDGMQFRTIVDQHKHVIMTMSYPNDISLKFDSYTNNAPQGDTLSRTNPQIVDALTSVDFEKMLRKLQDDPDRFEVTMRNFTQVLNSLAKEESSFEYLATHQKEAQGFYVDLENQDELYYPANFDKSVIFLEPRTSRMPVHFLLKTYYRTGNPDAYTVNCENIFPILLMKGIPPLADTSYRELLSIQHGGSSYSVGDLVWSFDKDESIDYNRCYLKEEEGEFPEIKSRRYELNFFPGKFSNRSVFSVVSSLFNQVAADPKSLPQQQLIQVQ